MLYGTQNPHGGDVYGAEVTFDFSSNVNPLGTPPNVLAAISHAACGCGSIRTPTAAR